MHSGLGLGKLDEYLKPLLVERSSKRVGRQASGVVMTGFKALDDMLGGFKPHDLVVLAAGTRIGKSSFASCSQELR